jgi:hypothetical protein
VIVGLAFAAAAGVGLAQITAEPSATVSAESTSALQSTGATSAGKEGDFADDESEADDNELEFEQAETGSASNLQNTSKTTSAIGQQTSTIGAEGAGQGQVKVDVCHVTGNGSSHTINIAEPAVAAHVAHGDTATTCAPTTTAAVTTTAAPTQSTTTTTTKHTKKPKQEHATTHATSHGNSSHSSHGNSSHSSHGNSGHASHGNSSHGGGHGKGHGK